MSSANPSAIALAQYQLDSVIKLQMALGAKQKAILYQMEFNRMAAGKQFRSVIHDSIQASLSRNLFPLQIKNLQFDSGQNALIPDRSEDFAPIYELAPLLTQKHQMSGNWSLEIQNKWLPEQSHKKWTVPGSCQATFFERGSEWLAILVRDRF